ncbi:MAG: hypothetical protein ACYDD7_12665 [Acidimicrobiales bacterium]
MATPWLVLILPAVWRRGPGSSFGDVASTEVAIQNALKLHQALGPYDRFGWFHPGPALFYVLAAPYAVLGHNAIGLAVAACIINMLSGVAIVMLVGRRAGPKAALGSAAVILVFMAMIGVPDMRDVWSPMVITFPAALFVVLCVETACGGTFSAVAAVGLGVLLVQTEVGLLTIVLFALAATLVLRILRPQTEGASLGDRIRRRPVVVAGVCSLVLALGMWTPPLIQQVTGRPGNVSSIAQFFTSHQAHHQLSTVYNSLTNGMLLSFGPHLLPAVPAPLAGYGGQFAILLGLVAAVCAACLYRRQPFGLLLSSSALVLAAVYGVGLSRAEGNVGGYLVVWTRGLTLCAALGAVVAILGTPSGKQEHADPDPRRRVSLVGAVGLAAILAALTGFETSIVARSPIRDYFGTVRIAARTVRRVVPPQRRRALICIGSPVAWAHAAGVIADLRRGGEWDLHVPPPWLHTFGDELKPTGHEREVVFLEVHGPRHPWPLAPVVLASGGGLDVAAYAVPDGEASPQLCPTLGL